MKDLYRILNYFESPCSFLFEEANQITFQQWCINSLMIEVYKYLNGHSPDIMNIFKLREICTISKTFTSSWQKTFIHWNTDSKLFQIFLSKLWQQVPIDICQVASLAYFKNCIKKIEDCLCRSCKYSFKMLDIFD